MKTKKDEPTRKRKAKTAAEKAASTRGESTPIGEDTGDHVAAASELTNRRQESVAEELPGPSLALLIGDTDAVLPHEVDSGKPDTEPLTAQEQLDLHRCEIVIEENQAAFLDTIAAMHEIWAKRLYRAEYRSFKQYCKKRWDFSRAYGYRLVEAHRIIQQLSTVVDTSNATTSATQALELAKLSKQQRVAVLTEATKKAGNGKMTSRHIKEAAQELKAGITAQNATSAPPPGGTPKCNTAKITTPAKVCPDAKILPLGELSKMAATLHDIFLNRSRHGEAVELLLKLKEQLRLYAEREAQHLGEAQLKQAA